MQQGKSSILVTGCKGRLGSLLVKHLKADGIDRDELDIADGAAVSAFFSAHQYDIVIHCAAFTDVAGAESDKSSCFSVNVTGTENLIRSFSGKKFVYISTDYVFRGDRGNYNENDTPDPINYYGLTKLLGEYAVRQYANTLIIRTTFKPDGPWPYPKAFTDLYTSADFVSERAPQIAQAALREDLYGTIHIAGERKSIHELARRASPDVGMMSITDVSTPLPSDITLDSSRWKSMISGQN